MAQNEAQQKIESSYLNDLPAAFQQDDDEGKVPFIGRFLLAFEQVLTGLGNVDKPGLEEVLAGIHHYFDPGPKPDNHERAPTEFLAWLAGWVALSLRADWDEERQRRFIARAVSLYRLRGTKQGLEKLINIYTGMPPSIDEFNTPFQIGVHSTIGLDTVLDGGAPHFFKVTLRLRDPDPEQRRHIIEVAPAVIDLEKPAHTFYVLDVVTPILQIGVHSTIGVDTVVGSKAPQDNPIEEETS